MPLIIWLFKREASDFIDFHGKSYLNYFINVFPIFFICLMLSYTGFGKFCLILTVIYGTIFGVISTIKAYQGEYYEYPFLIRVLKR